MKSFNELLKEFENFNDDHLDYLNEAERQEIFSLYCILNESYEKDGIEGIENKINEGILGTVAGFIIGPTIGKIIANALGIEKGILYDMLTSRLVSAALGNAIQNRNK